MRWRISTCSFLTACWDLRSDVQFRRHLCRFENSAPWPLCERLRHEDSTEATNWTSLSFGIGWSLLWAHLFVQLLSLHWPRLADGWGHMRFCATYRLGSTVHVVFQHCSFPFPFLYSVNLAMMLSSIRIWYVARSSSSICCCRLGAQIACAFLEDWRPNWP